MSILRSPLLAAHESERLIEHRLQHAFQAETRSTHPPHMHITTTKAIASAVIAISAISAAAVSTPLRSKEGRSTDQIINPKQNPSLPSRASLLPHTRPSAAQRIEQTAPPSTLSRGSAASSDAHPSKPTAPAEPPGQLLARSQSHNLHVTQQPSRPI